MVVSGCVAGSFCASAVFALVAGEFAIQMITISF
jgi:hypothetical protein